MAHPGPAVHTAGMPRDQQTPRIDGACAYRGARARCGAQEIVGPFGSPAVPSDLASGRAVRLWRPQAPTVPYAGSGVLRPEVPLGAGLGSGEDEERSAPMTDRAIRASDKERESVVDVLRDAYTDGRLTLDEFEERTSAGHPCTRSEEHTSELQSLA